VDSLQGAPAPPTAVGQLTVLYQAHALGLVRLAVLMIGEPTAEDVVQDAFLGLQRRWSYLAEEHREVLAALRRLPARQREAVVLRYYLDMTEGQAAQAMRVTKGTVKSATSRGLAALARQLKEEPAA
jgi:DNA-directed RNA polymerase specialized sigma24 family protein